MLRLMLFRHAKSSWAKTGLAEIDRPLAPRGRRQAAEMAEALQTAGLLPARIVCSSALRARQTLARMLETLLPALPEAAEIVISGDLYGADADYLPVLARRTDAASPLMLVGHNPAMQTTALALCGSGETAQREALQAKFPTSALAVIDFNADKWADARPGTGRLAEFLTPA
jgi:phosphohistidine phosphatase